MQPAKKRHIFRSLILTVLLAVACIGVSELAFCRTNDPKLYHTVVDPVVELGREACQKAAAQLKAASLEVGDRLNALSLALEEQVRQAAARRLARAQAGEEDPPAGAEGPALPEAPAAAVTLAYDGGLELLTGGDVPVIYFNQTDPAWSDQLFGRDPIGAYGCGPTAMAMVVSTLTDETVDPAEMAAVAAGAGYWSRGCGSALSIVPGIARQYGLDCTSLPVSDPAALEAALFEGGFVVALMGPGHFTRGGHFVLLHSLSGDGTVLVTDPNSRVNSLTRWDLSFIRSELSAGRGAGAPLWLISVPAQP